VDVNGALIGEVWRVGEVELRVTFGRIPCSTFQVRMAEPHWVKRFAAANRTGAYLRVVTRGEVSAGDPVRVVHRPERSLSIADAFRIFMTDHDSLERLLDVDGLPEDLRAHVERKLAR
jgi:MOSC domain-containing protein YiiM